MPYAPRTACSTPGCPGYARYRGKCPSCARTRERYRGTRQERGYTQAWLILRARVMQEEPLCRECERRGVHTFSEEVDHIIPMADAPHLRLVRENLQALCRVCHGRKTMKDVANRPAI